MKSSILLIGPASDDAKRASDIGAEYVPSFEEAELALKDNRYAVIVVTIDKALLKQIDRFTEVVEASNPDVKVVVSHNGLLAQDLQKVINHISPHRIVEEGDPIFFQDSVQSALAEYSLLEQNTQMMDLISSQNEKLRKLSLELENRVEKRQKYLANAKEKLQSSNARVEALHKALVAIHQADSVKDLETLLIKALQDGLTLAWIRILFNVEEFFEKQQEFSEFDVFSAPLVQDKEMIGQIYFARERENPLRKEEHNFLIQVADAASLALDRLNHLEQAKTLKRQWESTFDAITAPLSLVTRDYKILRCNQAFARRTGKNITTIIGDTCYKTLFQRTSPCARCNLGSSFRLAPQRSGEGKNYTFEVSSQKLTLPITDQESFVVVYQDITDQKRWERQLIESAKMAEIGTIGSSIAHELNNPLGGMLSFIQLIKSDLRGDEEFYEDIIEMEKGAQNCKEIVQNLLSFSRNPSNDERETTSIKDLMNRAVKVTELQTKSKGIEIDMAVDEKNDSVECYKTMLTQAFRHILQSLCNGLENQLDTGTESSSIIQLTSQVHDDSVEIDFQIPSDERRASLDLENTEDLSLTVTNQIIVEHAGTLEVFRQGQNNTHFKVILPRPET